MTLLLGCIADDFTGATDLANNLVRAGLRVVQTIGVPAAPLGIEVDAIVVAVAEPDGRVLTGDPEDLEALAGHADHVLVETI